MNVPENSIGFDSPHDVSTKPVEVTITLKIIIDTEVKDDEDSWEEVLETAEELAEYKLTPIIERGFTIITTSSKFLK